MTASLSALRGVGGALAMGLLLAVAAPANVARLERAVDQRPKDLRLRFLLGKEYSKQGKYPQAIRQYEDILRVRALPTVMFQLGLAYARQGNLTAAVLNWTPILERKPNNTTTMGYMGLALYKQGLQSPTEELRQRLFEESLDWWKRILKLDPSNLRARYFSGLEYFKLNRFEDAARQWLIFLRVKKNHPKVLALLAKALMKLGKYEQARRTLDHLQGLPAAGAPSIRAFLAKAYAHLDAGPPRDRPPTSSNLEPDDLQEGAVTHTPGEFVERPLPPGDEPPPPPDMPEPGSPRPPQIPVDEPVTLQAETLFLDGLEFKEKGNYEKALFAFLQAIDIQPEFSQVYLQIGEVYLGLAKLAPTPDEFKERMRLAEDALEKVKKLSPSTLLAHAAQAKLTVVKRSQSLGFQGYHEEVAKQAIQEQRYTDAFDELVLLLSVKDFRPRTFFQLAGIVDLLSEASRQDLRFFLEELKNQHPGHHMTSYLLGRVYLTMATDAIALKMAGPEFENAWGGFAKDEDVREAFLTYRSTPRANPVDGYVAAKMFALIRKHQEALDAVSAFLEGVGEEHLFYRDAAKLKEQLSIALRPIQTGAARVDYFKEELDLLRRTVRESRLFFEEVDGIPQLSPGHLEDEARYRALRIFVDNNPGNGLGRFLLGWLETRRAQSLRAPSGQVERRDEGQELMAQVHREHLSDPRYHHQLAQECLHWALVDKDMEGQAELFFQATRQILLSLGRTQDKATALETLKAARRWIFLGKLDRARHLVELAARYDPTTLQAHALRFELAWSEGAFFEALWGLVVWFKDALGHPFVRQVMLSDVAILLFLSLLVAAFGWGAVLLIRYHAELHAMFTRFWARKGAILPLSLFMAVALVALFPTGFVLFLPFLTWPVMRTAERRTYALVVAGLVLVPFFLPLSMETNYRLLASYEAIRSGQLEGAATELEAQLARDADDPVRLYLLSLVHLRLGELSAAEPVLERLSRMDTASKGVDLNRGVLAARQGDYEAAERHFSKALEKDPTNARAHFDLSCLYAIQGNEEKKAQFRGWALQTAGDSLPIEEMVAIPESITRLPLLDQPLEPEELASYFDFYSTSNFLALNASLLAFLGWLVAGGGLCGLLLFLRERMDVDMTAAGRDEKVDMADLKAKAQGQARILNLLLPGLGLTYVGRPALGSLLFLGAVFLFLVFWSGGGWLLHAVFPVVDPGPIPVLLALALVATAGLYLIAQYLIWSKREDIQAR